ncbi:unnamed protein product [Pleuronectes platessa]|uniref:Uncharacterized protein n=1 Tax=Pleuronectes platessa TaxID=8262 RepID=A0A9N7U236_PLEPL|nr:unnamed protein product [Pleuronectes platessa]
MKFNRRQKEEELPQPRPVNDVIVRSSGWPDRGSPRSAENPEPAPLVPVVPLEEPPLTHSTRFLSPAETSTAP